MVFTIGLGKGLAWRYKCGMRQVDSIEVMRLPAVTKERVGEGKGPGLSPGNSNVNGRSKGDCERADDVHGAPGPGENNDVFPRNLEKYQLSL